MEHPNSTKSVPVSNDPAFGSEDDGRAPGTSVGTDKLAPLKTTTDAPGTKSNTIEVPRQGQAFSGRRRKGRRPRRSRKAKSKKAKAMVRRSAGTWGLKQNQKKFGRGRPDRSGGVDGETQGTISTDARTKMVDKGTQTTSTPASKEAGVQTIYAAARSMTRDSGTQTNEAASVQLASGSPTMPPAVPGGHKRRHRRQCRSTNARNRAVFAASAASVLPSSVDDQEDDNDDDHSAAASPTIPRPDVDSGEIISLSELCQLLKLQAIGDQKPSPVICMRVGVDRLPQPQDYREAQRDRQLTLGSLERQLRGRSRANRAPGSGREQPPPAQQSQPRLDAGHTAQAAAGGSARKAKKGKASNKIGCSPAFQPKPPRRRSSTDGDAGTALPHHGTASSPVVSKAQSTSLNPSATETPFPPLAPLAIQPATSTTLDKLPGRSPLAFLHDASCPLPAPTAPTLCFHAGRVPDRNPPDLTFRTIHPVDYVISNKEATRRNEILRAEKRRNAERKLAAERGRRESLRQLRMASALRKTSAGDDGGAGTSAEASDGARVVR